MNNTKLAKAVNRYLKTCKFKVLLQTTNKLKNYFCFKDLVPETLCSNRVYKFTFINLSCAGSYKGKTYIHMKVRVLEQQCVPQRIGKPLNGTFSTSVRNHMLICNHQVGILGKF